MARSLRRRFVGVIRIPLPVILCIERRTYNTSRSRSTSCRRRAIASPRRRPVHTRSPITGSIEPPRIGHGYDWALVLDDMARGFALP